MTLRLAHVVNQYDAPSSTFVRREAAALEAHAAHEVSVHRVSIRGSASRSGHEPLHVLLPNGASATAALSLLSSSLRRLSAPRALATAMAMTNDLRAAGTPAHVASAYLAEAAALLQWCTEQRIDHVHAHFGTNPAAVAMLCHALGGPSFSFTVHGPEEFDRQETLALRLKLQHARFVAAVSSYGRSQLWRLMSHDQWRKVFIVPCVVDPMYLDEPTPMSSNGPLVQVARLHEQKGQLALVDAVASMTGPKPTIDLYGDGPLKAELHSRIHDAGLQAHIRLRGNATPQEVRAAILASRGLVLPSFAEGLPVVLMEAMACARPVLSTYIAGIPELVDSECGFMIPAGHTQALATALADMTSASTTKLTRMGRIGRERALQRHAPSVAAQALVAALHTM
jgi:colanic acid/amylovoran biosynthesis glycosyltransferase